MDFLRQANKMGRQKPPVISTVFRKIIFQVVDVTLFKELSWSGVARDIEDTDYKYSLKSQKHIVSILCGTYLPT